MPTAPFHVNAVPAPTPTPGEAPVTAPSVVAGSPRTSVPGYGVLKTVGNSAPVLPEAMSASPESGPKENINVCVPSASVMYPSPPDTCWHLIAPFTVPAVGTAHCCEPVAGLVNCVGPLYGGSELLFPGWVIVLGGHCTRND